MKKLLTIFIVLVTLGTNLIAQTAKQSKPHYTEIERHRANQLIDWLDLDAAFGKQMHINMQQSGDFFHYAFSKYDENMQTYFAQVKNGNITNKKTALQYWKNKLPYYRNLYNTNYQTYVATQTASNAKQSNSVYTGGSICNNLDFSTGNTNGWVGAYATDNTSTTQNYGATITNCFNPLTSGLNSSGTNNLAYVHEICTAGPDPHVSINRVPSGHTYSLRLGNDQGWEYTTGESSTDGYNHQTIKNTFTVTPQNEMVTCLFAVVFSQAVPHDSNEAPYIKIHVFDAGCNQILGYTMDENTAVSTSGYLVADTIQDSYGDAEQFTYSNWMSIPVVLSNYVGQAVTILVETSDCSLGSHFTYAYITADCGTIPTLTLSQSYVCNNTITLTAPSGYNAYNWSGPGIVGTSTTQAIQANTGGTYSATITSSSGVSFVIDTVIGSSFPLQIAASPTVICTGQSTELTATGATTYTWNTNDTGSAVQVTPTQNTTYTVTGTDANGCVETNTITVNVNSLPTLTATNATICAGQSYTLSANGVNTYTYSGGSQTVSPGTTTIYVISGTDANGCIGNINDTVSVNQLPVLTVTNGTICVGQSYTLIASGVNTYTWNTTETTNSITPSPTVTTNYTVTGTDINGCVNSSSSTITVNSLPTISVNSSTICVGTTATLTTGGATTYTWSTNDTGVAITPSPTITTNYSVTGTDVNGCVNSNSTTVTVNSIPSIVISYTNVTCYGLNNGIANASIIGNFPYTYNWSPSGGNDSIANNLVIGNYTLAVTDINNCNNSATVSINQPNLLSVSPTQTTKDCGNSNGVATSIASGGTTPYLYGWSTTPSQTNSTAINLSAGIYTCTVQDANGCSNITSVIISDSCDMVWPGDANNDLIADNNDILAIGIGNTISGTTRNNATINWVAQPSANWADTLANGANYKHIDCDGNGAINLSDTVAVIQNFNLTHPASKLTHSNQTYTSGAPLILVPQQNNILSGNSGTFDIMLGNSITLANNAYGIAFTMQYDNTYIDGTSIAINGNGSWLGAVNSNVIALALRNIPQSEIEFAVTKTDHNNITGQGKIGEITFKTLTNLANNSTASFSISNVNLISYNQNNIPVDLSAGTTTVNIVATTGINQLSSNNDFNIYPNPNNGTFIIETNNSAKQIMQIFDVNGRLVLNQTITGKTIINANDLMNGVYNINISSNEGVVNKRLIITR